MKDAIRYALVLSALVHIGLQAYAAVSSGQWNGRHAGLIRAPGDPRLTGSPSLTGCYLAIVAPLAPGWVWPPLALGLYWSGSWLAYGALSAASLVGLPVAMGWVPIALLSTALVAVGASRRLGGGWRWAEWTPRGDSLDSITLRVRTWGVVARSLPTLLRHHPLGRRPLGRDLRTYITATGATIHADHAFNEYLQVSYEWGILGACSVALVVASVGLVLSGVSAMLPDRHDPFFVALTVWLLTMTGSLTLRTWPFPLLGVLLLIGGVT